MHPERMAGADHDKTVERDALARIERIVAARLSAGEASGDAAGGFLGEIARRWDDVDEADRVRGVTGDVVLLHVATMTNLFAALGWTLCLVLLDPDVRSRVEAGAVGGSVDRGFLDRCALEAVRIGQRSIMLRSVLKPCELDDGAATYRVEPGVLLATMLPLTNTTALPGWPASIPIAGSAGGCATTTPLDAKEVVTTFGHGSHRCPAQRFSLSAIGRAVERLFATFEMQPGFDSGARGPVADRRSRAVGRPVPGRLRPQARHYPARRRPRVRG